MATAKGDPGERDRSVAARFASDRDHLRAVAYRMLPGSPGSRWHSGPREGTPMPTNGTFVGS
jgi:hypothetical protein